MEQINRVDYLVLWNLHITASPDSVREINRRWTKSAASLQSVKSYGGLIRNCLSAGRPILPPVASWQGTREGVNFSLSENFLVKVHNLGLEIPILGEF